MAGAEHKRIQELEQALVDAEEAVAAAKARAKRWKVHAISGRLAARQLSAAWARVTELELKVSEECQPAPAELVRAANEANARTEQYRNLLDTLRAWFSLPGEPDPSAEPDWIRQISAVLSGSSAEAREPVRGCYPSCRPEIEARVRAATIEECARIVESMLYGSARPVASAIRALAAPTPGRLFEAARAMPSSVLVSPTPLAPTARFAPWTTPDPEADARIDALVAAQPKCNCYRSLTDPYVANPYPCPVHDAEPQRTPESE
jgi:hypothetical protein